MLDLGSEVQWFNTHWGNILLLEFFVFTNKEGDANIGIIAILVYFEKTLMHHSSFSQLIQSCQKW